MINNLISSCMAVGCMTVIALVLFSTIVPFSIHVVLGGGALLGIFSVFAVLSGVLSVGSSAKKKGKRKR